MRYLLNTDEFHEFWWFSVFCREMLKICKIDIIWNLCQGGLKRGLRIVANITITNYLKCPIGLHHYEELIEMNEMDFWFT